MAKKQKYDVFLTFDAIQLLNKEPIFQLLLKNNQYLTCKLAEQNGHFIDLIVICPKKEIKIPDSYLSIPCNYVLYMISGDSNKILGFSMTDELKKSDDDG